MRNVFVIQDVQGKDLQPATKFGELTVILRGNEDSEMATLKLTKKLSDMQADDYLLLIGSPVNIIIAAYIALRNGGGRLNLLVWDREHHKYNEQQIHL